MPNAVQLVKQDHKKVASLFEKYNKTKGQEAKQRIADQAMQQLEVHAQIEEEIFYPAVKKAIDDGALVGEALNEHKAVKELIDELKEHVVKKIGALARPDQILFAADLPKTRSGKIMRRLLRDIAEGKTLGDTTTLADPNVVAKLKDEYEALE